jgi:hypothetical protein
MAPRESGRAQLPPELAYAVDAFAAVTLDYIASVMRQHPTEEWRKVARADMARTISNVLVDPIGHGITTPEQNDQDRWDDYKLQMGEPINYRAMRVQLPSRTYEPGEE